jgi:hypothetical protein
MAILHNPAKAAYPALVGNLDLYSGPQDPHDGADWVSQALKARQVALRLMLSNLEMTNKIEGQEPSHRATAESIADLTEEHLLESEKLFESTCALVRGTPTRG